MPFRPVAPEKLSSAVVRQIETLILRGILSPGDRLPAERDLAERLNVSRPSLRDALAQLTERGLLVTRAGSGITVADVLGSAFSPALIELFETHDEAQLDHIAFRRDLEGMAAARAAEHGTPTDLAVIDTALRQMLAPDKGRTAEEDARLDAAFHMAIFEAAHNVVMLHMMRSMYDLLRAGVFYNRDLMFRRNTTREALLDQHRAVNDAIQARDAQGARDAMHAHLDYMADCLTAQRRMTKNEDIARLRLDQRGAQTPKS